MKVLQLIPGIQPDRGGPSRSVPALCRALASAKAEVTLFTLTRPAEAISIEPESEPYRVVFGRPLIGIQTPTRASWQQLETLVAAHDVVHINSIWNAFGSMAAHFARKHGVPYVVSPRGMLQTQSLRKSRLRKAIYRLSIEGKTINRAAGYHFFNDVEARESMEAIGTPAMPYAVIPSGVDRALRDRVHGAAIARRFPHLAGKPLVVFLGRLHPTKNLQLQVEAFRHVAAVQPDALWVFAGPDDGELAGLQASVAGTPIADRCIWTGLLDEEEALSLLSIARVFVLTSHHEAHSMAMNQALALGVPVVTTEAGAFTLGREYGALTVTASNALALSDRVLTILRDPAVAMRLRDAGWRLVDEQLDWSKVSGRFLDFYDQCLGRLASHRDAKSALKFSVRESIG